MSFPYYLILLCSFLMFAKSHTEMCFLLFLLFASVLKTCDQHDCLFPYILVQRNFMENVENIDI